MRTLLSYLWFWLCGVAVAMFLGVAVGADAKHPAAPFLAGAILAALFTLLYIPFAISSYRDVERPARRR